MSAPGQTGADLACERCGAALDDKTWAVWCDCCGRYWCGACEQHGLAHGIRSLADFMT